ncbi:MAG: GntR family transcriptional regulator [Actinomycetota bacterium]|nr:GntR family transcriptional regulator [Actinomycetota bacterium]
MTTTGLVGEAVAMAPLTVATVVDEVVDRLLTALALGEFVPGERLPAEREMARLLGVSRTTVRVALARLREGEVVEVKRGRAGGAFVTQSWQPESAAAVSRTLVPRRAEIEELGDLRCRYEEMVARTAAEVRSAAAAVELLSLLDSFILARTPQDEHRTDMAIHEGVLRATGNPQMAAISRELLTRTSLGLSIEPYDREFYGQAVTEHAALVMAIVEGRVDDAGAIAREHFAMSARTLSTVISRGAEVQHAGTARAGPDPMPEDAYRGCRAVGPAVAEALGQIGCENPPADLRG